jgi:predicted dehydrogenase
MHGRSVERRLKILICGLGSIGQRHVRNLRKVAGDGVELLAYRRRGRRDVLTADMQIKNGASVEEEYGIRSFTDLGEALAERPDAAVIANPTSEHVRTARAAAEAGCHLFIEKPISHSTEGLAELLESVERRGLAAFVAFQFRFHPGLQRLHELISTGALGSIAAAHIVNGEFLPAWHPYEDYRDTHPARRDLGGGCLNIQSHELDYAQWLFGMPSRVYAVGGHLSNLEVDVEDSVSLLLSCGNGAGRFPVHVHLDYLQRPPQRVCEVIGDRGKVRYDYYLNQVELHNTDASDVHLERFDPFDRNDMFVNEIRHFLSCVRGVERPVVDLREGIRSLRVAMAAHQSLRTGQAVDVHDV